MGPWKIVYGTSCITEKDLVQVIDEIGEVICDNERYYPTELDPKYAPLIAAAPELLGALEEMHAQFKANADYADEDREILEQARIIIAQAKGENS